jgi:hypothetical protein
MRSSNSFGHLADCHSINIRHHEYELQILLQNNLKMKSELDIWVDPKNKFWSKFAHV